jgi:hypothetical protein
LIKLSDPFDHRRLLRFTLLSTGVISYLNKGLLSTSNRPAAIAGIRYIGSIRDEKKIIF